MTAIFSLEKWFEITERGTSGDQVSDILYSWKKDRAELEATIAAYENDLPLLAATEKVKELKAESAALKHAVDDIANKEILESIEKWKDLLNEFSNQIDRFNKLLLNFADVLEKSNKEDPREDDPRPHLDVGIIKCPYEGCEGYLITTGVVDDIGEIYRCSACRKEFHGRDT